MFTAKLLIAAAVPLGLAAAAPAQARPPAGLDAVATERTSVALLLAQAPGGATPQGRHPPEKHLDNTTDGPAPHEPRGSANRADGGGQAAHLHNEGGGETTSHRPDARPSTAGGTGAPAHLDNQPGDGPAPHRPGRGSP